jgi:hypothetical protein
VCIIVSRNPGQGYETEYCNESFFICCEEKPTVESARYSLCPLKSRRVLAECDVTVA